jgi:tetratricopeptide (TPR) repeat protein
MYAKFGRLRGQMQTLPLPDISEQIATDLESAVAVQDRALRLRGLTVKGEIDLEWDIRAAERDWEEAQRVAKELGDPGWENRSSGELGIIAFLKGNTGEATKLVQQALAVATQTGDVGGQLRYMGTIANGLLLAGYATQATGFVDRALKFAVEHPEVGFPYVVYSTKVLTLLESNQPDEAERFAKAAMSQAVAGDRRIKEVELLMLLARVASQRGHSDEAVHYLEKASAGADAGHVRRLHADAESLLAAEYRARGDLSRAKQHALLAVEETQADGSRFTMPVHLRILAEVYAAQGNFLAANRTYEQASDIVEGIMFNVPSREAQARLIGVRSNLYEGHFRWSRTALAAQLPHSTSSNVRVGEPRRMCCGPPRRRPRAWCRLSLRVRRERFPCFRRACCGRSCPASGEPCSINSGR